MTDVTLLGLGAMGTAIGRTLLSRGTSVTLWNRTSAKAESLAGDGAVIALTVPEAIDSSPIVLVCVTDYAATNAVLDGARLEGKTLIQLSTGTPGEARAAATATTAAGAKYLDGAILAVPSQIGTQESGIFVSGSRDAFVEGEPLLARVAGALNYVGEDAGAAAAFDLAILSCLFGSLLGFYHGAQVVAAEQIGVEKLGEALVAVMPAIGQMIQHDAQTIVTGGYENPEASLEICWSSMKLLEQQAREAGLDAQFPEFAASSFERGMTAGLGGESPAALTKVLRAAGARRHAA